MAYLTKNIQSKSTLVKLTHHAFPERKLESLHELTEGCFNIAYEVFFRDVAIRLWKLDFGPTHNRLIF